MSAEFNPRSASLAVMIWGILAEQVGTELTTKLGINSGNVSRLSSLPDDPRYAMEASRLIAESRVVATLSEMLTAVYELAVTAVENVDAKGGVN